MESVKRINIPAPQREREHFRFEVSGDDEFIGPSGHNVQQ